MFKKYNEFVLESINNIKKSVDNINKNINNLTDTDGKYIERIDNKLQNADKFIDNIVHLTLIEELFVDKKGFSKSDFNNIRHILNKYTKNDIENLANYLNDNDDKQTWDISKFTKFTKPVNLPKILSSEINVDENLLIELFTLSGIMKGGKGVGRGELFLGLMVDGAENSDSGDLNINGNIYEVKAGEARLNGQNGFTLGRTGIDNMLIKLKQLDINVYNKYIEYKKNEGDDFYLSWNLRGNSINGKSRFGNLVYDIKELDDNDKLNKLIDVISETYLTMWHNSSKNVKDIINFAVKSYINSNEIDDKNPVDFNTTLLYANLLYYKELFKFKGIFLFNYKSKGDSTNGNFVYYDNDIIGNIKDNIEWLKNYTTLISPNYKDNPTSNSFKINLK